MDVTPPAPPRKASRLDAAEADRIAAIYNVRTFPLPPGDLLGEEVFENDQRGTERLDEAAKRVVAPHWNTAVDLLGDGAEGYLALVRLRDRLAGRIAEIVHEADQRSIHADIAGSIRQILAHEAERYGSDAQIGDSLASLTEPADEDGWWWEPRRSYSQQQLPVAGAPPVLFALRSTYLDGLVATYEWEFNDTLVEFEREWTWSRALNRATANEAQAERARLGGDDRAHELAEFRLRVVEQVLMEHEVLGHVDEFGTGAHRRVMLTPEQTTFLDAALTAIAEVEVDAEDPSNRRRRSWSNVSGRMADETGWSPGTLERIAEESFTLFGGPAFVKQEARGSGPLPRPEEIERYELFRRVMQAYDRARSAPEEASSA